MYLSSNVMGDILHEVEEFVKKVVVAYFKILVQ